MQVTPQHRRTLLRLIGIVLALGTAACRDSGASSAAATANRTAAAPIPAVEVVEAREGALPLSERLTGTVRATGEVAIYPQTEGSVIRVHAQNGDRVRKGSPLVEIQTAGVQAQVAQAHSSLEAARAEVRHAEANLEQLESQFERNQILGEHGLVPADTVATLRAQVAAARANLARAKAQVAVAEATVAERADIQRQTLVRAPITGRVGQRNAEVGMRVDPQTALFVVGQLDRVRVEVPVTQEIVTRVREGQRVELHVYGAANRPITASVSRVSPFLAAGSYSAEVEIDVPNETGTLVPGMFVTVDIFYGESARATLVPTSALYQHPTTGEQGVFVTDHPSPATRTQRPPSDQSADAPDVTAALAAPVAIPFRQVDIVAEGQQTVGIRGVDAGEWVVVVGQHLLSEQSGTGPPQARVRTIAWDRILELQRLQRQDLLRQFMDKQQRLVDQRSPSTSQSLATATSDET